MYFVVIDAFFWCNFARVKKMTNIRYAHRAPHWGLQLKHRLPTLRSVHTPCLVALLGHFRYIETLVQNDILARCWGYLSHLCNEECSEQVSPPPFHHYRSHDPSPGRVLCPRLLFHHQWEDLHDDVRCRRKTNDECCVLWRKHEHGVLDSARLHS